MKVNPTDLVSPTLIALDVETTMRCKREGFISSTPWYKGNEILLLGMHDDLLEDQSSGSFFIGEPSSEHALTFLKRITPEFVLCGHHIKFDLHHLAQMKDTSLYHLCMSVPIWDTSIAHYILTNMVAKWPSLDEVARYYKLPLSKGDLIERLIEDGKDTTDADPMELRDYLKTDLILTRQIALLQMKEANERGMLKLIYTMCAAMKAIQEMELRGIQLDIKKALNVKHTLENLISIDEKELATDIVDRVSLACLHVPLEVLQQGVESWLNSNQFWSVFFFGGKYKWKYKLFDGVWKSGLKKGQIKFKSQEEVLSLPKLLPLPAIEYTTSRGKNGYFSVDERVLQQIGKLASSAWPHIDVLLAIKKHKKLLSTYVIPLPTKLWERDTLHPNIHQTSTETGRLSSSNPNMQNQDDMVKSLFVPRPGFSFIEADYKQLEVVALAYLSGDPALLEDIRNGVDIHDVVAAEIYGTTYSKEERRIVKGVNFGTIYGGGVETIAKQSGLDTNLVWNIRSAFWARYSTIRRYRDACMKDVEKTHSFAKGSGYLTSPTGRCYTIPVDKSPSTHGMSLKPHYTKVCNYPIQGFATADIVPMMLAHMRGWLALREEGSTLVTMVNTVHDSILFEVGSTDKRELTSIGEDIKEQLQLAPEILNKVFKIPFDLPLLVDVQYSTESYGGPWNKLIGEG